VHVGHYLPALCNRRISLNIAEEKKTKMNCIADDEEKKGKCEAWLSNQ